MIFLPLIWLKVVPMDVLREGIVLSHLFLTRNEMNVNLEFYSVIGAVGHDYLQTDLLTIVDVISQAQ